MIERDCANCKHHTEDGCSKWDCEFEAKDLISRADAIEAVCDLYRVASLFNGGSDRREEWYDKAERLLSKCPSAEGEKWSLCDEMSPKELAPMLVTWVNHSPPEYYKHIKDMPLVDTAVYYRGGWYWWDATLIDILGEYGKDCGAELIDKDIEIIAWMPLPKPYKGGDSE